MMKNIFKIAILLSVLFAGIHTTSACWFPDPPEPCSYCGGSQHTITFIECPTCGATYASCTSHKCDDSECPGCGAVGVIHGFMPYHCCGAMSGMYVCQPRAAVTCGCGASYASPSHGLSTCPDCAMVYHVCVGHTCTVNPENPVPPVDDPPDTPYDPPQPGDPDYPFPVNPGDPPVVITDPPIIVLPPTDPGDTPLIVPVPPGSGTLPVNPDDPPVVITDPPIIVLPPTDPGDTPLIVPVPPGSGTLPVNPDDPPVVIPGDNGTPTVIIHPPDAEGEPPVIEYTYADPEVNNPAPEDPTQADPGIDPPEAGDPDPAPQPEIAKFYFTRLNQLAITKPVGTTYTVDLPMSVYTASTTGTWMGNATIYLHCVPDEVTSGATYIPAVTSAAVGPFTAPSLPLQLFGRGLYPNMTSSKGTDTWDSDDEFLLILSTEPDTADALVEVENCCDGAGCRYHLRVKFSETTKPGR